MPNSPTSPKKGNIVNDRSGYTALPNLESHKCFGCSPANPSGLQMTFFSKGQCVYSWVTVPDHMCGWHNLAHGGAISAILDEIMGRTAVYLLRKLIMTKTMTVDFIKPILIGREMKATGRVFEVKNEREALIEGFIHDDKDKVCAKAMGTFALFTPEVLMDKGMMDKDLIKDLTKLFSA